MEPEIEGHIPIPEINTSLGDLDTLKTGLFEFGPERRKGIFAMTFYDNFKYHKKLNMR